MSATKHWNTRVRERIGDVDAQVLAVRIIDAIHSGRTDEVQFVSRVNVKGGRLFRFMEAGRAFFALIDTDTWCCVTVMPPGFTVSRQGREPIKLRGRDL